VHFTQQVHTMPKQDTPAKPARRRHAQEFKRELVERSLQPGASVSGIALANGVNTNMLFRWRREQLRAAKEVPQRGAAQAVLLPVKLAAVEPAVVQPQGVVAGVCAPAAQGVIEVDIGAVRVRLRGVVDEANLRCVLHTLRAIA
jgi:transposase